MNFQGKPSNPDTQLFIGDLSPSVVEADLYSLASRHGEVIYIRILRHFQTKESLGIAFITFAQVQQASEGRKALNGTLLKGSYLRVAKYSRERDPEANLFISDLPENATAKDLDEVFSNFGPILSSKVSYSSRTQDELKSSTNDKELKSNRYGYVQFEKKDQAQKVIALGKVDILGTKATVQKFIPAGQRENLQWKNNLYIRGFGENMTSESLRIIFTQYGEITSHAVMHTKDFKGYDRYFAYVCYKNSEDAQKVISLLNNKTEHGILWYIAPHQSRSARKAKLIQDYRKKVDEWKRRNLFIKGLPLMLTENQLKEICMDYGSITSVKILKTENIVYHNNVAKQELLSKGSGFVCFATPESAALAMTGLKNKKIEEKTLFVHLWKPKEELIRDLNVLKMKKMHSQMMQYGMIYPQMMARGTPGRGKFRGEPMPLVPMKAAEPVKLPFETQGFYESKPEVQKRILGENLYPLVLENSNKKIAGKITGMLLEIDIDALVRLLKNPIEIVQKVKEAVEVLRKAWINNPEALSLLSE
ncbi:hypothetical protein SteCoe_8262 [Stentor coeruleus]|uniref:Polyadenylate-binding protein n=1 Tax=Stentor coeruleus TaxID=5963 RepID=A0A1R2CKT8_9CILI|nr:hypothetical protein SteCoe_8262 [Stentor coeruleus]